MRTIFALLGPGVALVLLVCGCSTATMYESTKAWQRNECQKLQDKAERDRCLASNNASYDTYRKQTETGKND